MDFLVLDQIALVKGDIIAGFTAKRLIPLPWGQVGFPVPGQVALQISGIITLLTAKRFVPLSRALVGSPANCQVAPDITTLFDVLVILIIFAGDDYERPVCPVEADCSPPAA